MSKFVWLDFETTGLNPEIHVPIQMAIRITDGLFSVVDEREWMIGGWSNTAWMQMSPAAREMHEKSGLLKVVQEEGKGIVAVTREAHDFLSSHLKDGEGILAGNSIHFDRMMLREYFSGLTRYLYYRQLDVSSLKVLLLEINPSLKQFEKNHAHTALADINESMGELKSYLPYLKTGESAPQNRGEKVLQRLKELRAGVERAFDEHDYESMERLLHKISLVEWMVGQFSYQEARDVLTKET